ncbi:hypothetical protein K3555_23655 (plasmid) [Leisingera sp. M527]|nr:hypothetical protein [Leisingera sp. M527]UWQ35493.1 hypothetical protein K3555_23655 [Leisingera sp. M527]
MSFDIASEEADATLEVGLRTAEKANFASSQNGVPILNRLLKKSGLDAA